MIRPRWRMPIIGILLSGLGLSAIYLLGRPANEAVAETRLVIELRVNDDEAVTVGPGTPLIFTVALRGSQQSGNSSIGSEKTPWHQLLTVELRRDGAAADLPVVPVGRPLSAYLMRDADGRPSWKEESRSVAELRGSEAIHVQRFALGPATIVDQARYAARARLKTRPEGFRGRSVEAFSNEIVVTVVRPTDDSARRRSDIDRLLLVAQYSVMRGLHADASRAAEELVALDPDNANAWVLLGDARAYDKRTFDALDAYQKALRLAQHGREPPVHILNKISAVMRPRGGR